MNQKTIITGVFCSISCLRFFVGLILGVILLYQVLPPVDEKIRFEDLALGKETKTILGFVDDVQIHCHNLYDIKPCLVGYDRKGFERPITLWLGNSQVHAINQYQSGEETAVPRLHYQLQQQGQYLLTFSQPNASLQEHYLLFSYLLGHFPIKKLVLPVVFDDMREDGVRTTLVDALKDQNTRGILQVTPVGQNLLSNYGDQDAAGNDMLALDNTIQEYTEKWLNNMFEEIWPLWGERAVLRGKFLGSLYLFRNWALGIKPTSTRRMIRGRYAKNREAYVEILDLAVKRGVDVLVYVVPLRNDVKIPYNLDEYSSFKIEMKSIATHRSVHFADFEGLVPNELWGTKASTSFVNLVNNFPTGILS